MSQCTETVIKKRGRPRTRVISVPYTKLTKEGLERVTESDWKKVVDHTKNIILDAWKNEGLMEDSVEQMVINIGNDSSSEEDSDSDSSDNEEEERGSNVSGIFPLSPVAERVLDFDEL
ncbi:hypothetical protein J6590_007694 [Homalodisca vitripennis]|nr:hypothetical protein J6590_007694 [Homalodisca vitripennis]